MTRTRPLDSCSATWCCTGSTISALGADAARDTTGALGAPTAPIPPAHAVAVLVAYLALALAVTAVVSARQDSADQRRRGYRPTERPLPEAAIA